MNEKRPAVYILASKRSGTLYTGVTSDLPERIAQHRDGQIGGFTKRYRVRDLVYYEWHQDMWSAIAREKAIKKWKRGWKVQLIEKDNPEWFDLSSEVFRL